MCSSGKSAKRWWRRTAGDHHHLGWRFCWRDSDSPRARTNSHPSLYRYDSRGNCIARSLPGAGWTYTVYDKGNRPVLTQDAAQRAQNANAWTFAIPDRLGRPALRGTTTMTVNAFADPYKNTVVQASLPKTPTYSGTYRGYVLSGITLSSPVLLEVDYYDAYGFAGTSPFPAANNADFAYDSSIGTSFSAYYSPSAQGLQTGSLLKVLDNTAGNQYLWSVSYFDDKCRVVQHRASTHLGGVEKDWFLYDFTGNATKRKTEHKPSSGTSLIETATQTYNTWGHPVKTTHKLGSGTAQVVSNRTYDKAGRLATDKRNGTAALKTTFSYNIRSWVKGITGTLFTETLKYQDGTPARWGGDVSQATWKDDRATQTKSYTFGYDTVGRLTAAAFSDAAGASINFTENVTAYDRNGNITGLQRYGRTSASAYGLIDNLAYTYSGNKATSIKDTGSAAYSSDFRFSNGTNNTYSYTYDAAGRMTADASKGISSITWNVLGLPQTVTFSGGAVINYSYAADGTKLREARTVSSTTTTTDYTGNLILENGTRSRLLFDGGYVSVSNNGYHFFITDHLGSVRVVANTSGTAEESDHYYPLGGPIAKYSTATSIQPVKYQGKEWGASKGLNLYDFGARRYDPATGRWLSQDPLAEKYYAHSPYLFCAANPVKFVDPEGESIRIKRNVRNALIDLAYIVATDRGSARVSNLIEALPQYDLTPVPLSSMARFTGKEIRYVKKPFKNRDGGTSSEFIAMGHELNHAYDHSLGVLLMHNGLSRGNTDLTESNAVSFENYLRSVYMMPALRSKYSGKVKGEGSFNPRTTRSKGEYVDDFQEIGSNESRTSIGFRYRKQTKDNNQTMFLIVGVDAHNHFFFNLYETEKEYQKATEKW